MGEADWGQTTGLKRKDWADILAIGLAVSVVALGGLTVVKPAIDNFGAVYKQNPFKPETTTTTTIRKVPGKPTETTINRQPAEGSWTERALGDSGLLLLRVAVVVLAAFLAAAAMQRLVMGDYALKVGPVEVPALTAASEDALTAIKADLEALGARLSKLESFRRVSLLDSSDTKRSLAKVAEELAQLKRRIDDLSNGRGPQ